MVCSLVAVNIPKPRQDCTVLCTSTVGESFKDLSYPHGSRLRHWWRRHYSGQLPKCHREAYCRDRGSAGRTCERGLHHGARPLWCPIRLRGPSTAGKMDFGKAPDLALSAQVGWSFAETSNRAASWQVEGRGRQGQVWAVHTEPSGDCGQCSSGKDCLRNLPPPGNSFKRLFGKQSASGQRQGPCGQGGAAVVHVVNVQRCPHVPRRAGLSTGSTYRYFIVEQIFWN